MDFLNSNSAIQLTQNLSNSEELVLATTEAPRLENIERPSLSYKDLIIEAIESDPASSSLLSSSTRSVGLAKLDTSQPFSSRLFRHFWTVVPELSDKQTLRRRNRAPNRGANRQKTNDTVRETTTTREDTACSGSGETSPSPSQSSISPPSDLPKPTASYGGMENILGDGYKAYGQSLLSAYLYQHGKCRGLHVMTKSSTFFKVTFLSQPFLLKEIN
ncbi:unnamed protein product [Strongylus vulgaris]|uniref:Uncharacterized protein n=1 Tax=Strongylus vulgaris TaxID=40348 RepID=A0A3P7L949_STRVU|nr:unnamed protein product [Strongylus vulgaris]